MKLKGKKVIDYIVICADHLDICLLVWLYWQDVACIYIKVWLCHMLNKILFYTLFFHTSALFEWNLQDCKELNLSQN